jgi:hypothetical protein
MQYVRVVALDFQGALSNETEVWVDDLSVLAFVHRKVDKGGNTCPIFGAKQAHWSQGISVHFLPGSFCRTWAAVQVDVQPIIGDVTTMSVGTQTRNECVMCDWAMLVTGITYSLART